MNSIDIQNNQPIHEIGNRGLAARVAGISLAAASILAACGKDGNNSETSYDFSLQGTTTTVESSTPSTGTRPESTTSTSEVATDNSEVSQLQNDFRKAVNGLLPQTCEDIVGDGIIGVKTGIDGLIVPDANALHDYVKDVRSTETKQWVDALGPALEEKDATADENFTALKGRLCEDPNYKNDISWFIATQLKIGNETFAEFMPEVFGKYKNMSVEEVDELSERLYTLLNKKPSDTTPEERSELSKLYAEHLEDAAAVAATLEVFNLGGSFSESTSLHLALDDGGFNRNTNPGAEVDMPGVTILNTKYNGEFLRFEAIGKDGNCYLILLINKEDGRPAKSLKCAVVPIPPSSSTPSTRPEVAVPVASHVIGGPGPDAGEEPDNDNNAGNNTTSSQAPNPSSSTSSTQVAGGDGNDNGEVTIP